LAEVTWAGRVLFHESEILFEWWRYEVNIKEPNLKKILLGKICARWCAKLTQRELDKRRGGLPPSGDGEPAVCADHGESAAYADCIELRRL